MVMEANHESEGRSFCRYAEFVKVEVTTQNVRVEMNFEKDLLERCVSNVFDRRWEEKKFLKKGLFQWIRIFLTMYLS